MRTDKIKKFLERPISHRGLHSNNAANPENSEVAFQKAIEHNYSIELDIQLLADDEIAVFHDDTLERICGVNKSIRDFTSKDLNDFRLMGSEYRIPLLKEVLNLINGRVPVLIEFKNLGEPGKIEQLSLNLLNKYSGHFAVQSFNPKSLGWFEKSAPDILRCQVSGDFKNTQLDPEIKYKLKYLLFQDISKPDFIAYDSQFLSTMIETLKILKLPIIAWTIRSDEEYENIKNYCDNIIFENFIPN